MGEAQAIPDNLNSFAAQLDHAGRALSDWISSVLTPAIEEYQATAVDLGGDIGYITVSEDGYLDGDIRGVLADQQATDQHVGVVGQAFETAAQSGNATVVLPPWINDVPPGEGGPRDQYGVVSLTDSGLDGFLLDDATAGQGTALAKTYEQGNDDDHVYQELIAHQNDPGYVAAFLNALYADGIGSTDPPMSDFMFPLLAGQGNPGTPDLAVQTPMIQSVVNAIGSGLMNPRAVLSFYRDSIGMHQDDELFTMLEANPAAVVAYVSAAQPYDFARHFDAGVDPAMASSYIGLFTAAMKADPEIAQACYQDVSSIFTSAPGMPAYSCADSAAMTKSIAAFLSAYVNATATPPPHGDPAQLSLWAAGEGKSMQTALQPFTAWVRQNDAANGQSSSDAEDNLSFIIGVVTTLIALPIAGPFAPAIGTTLSIASDLATDYVEPELAAELAAPADPQSDADRLTGACEAAAKAVLVVQLAQSGLLVGPNGQPIAPSDKATLLQLLHDSDDNASALAGYHVTGSSQTLFDMLGDVGDQFSPHPNKLS